MHFHWVGSDLFGAEDGRNHTLWFCGLRALIDQDGSELHLSQARVSCPDTGAADHICILRHKVKHLTGILTTKMSFLVDYIQLIQTQKK